MNPSSPAPAAPNRVGLGKSIAWAAGGVAALPAALAALWAVGIGGTTVRDLISKVGVSWGQVGLGLGIVAAFAAVVAITHSIRLAGARHQAEIARYRSAAQDMQ